MTNREAFEAVEQRLRDDFPPVFTLFGRGVAPMWLVARGLFPIAESIGSLLFASKGSSERLTRLFEEVLSRQRPEYEDLSHIIAQIWRNGLIHGDEPPVLKTGRKLIAWSLAVNSHVGNHLRVFPIGGSQYGFHFDLYHFHQDLIWACQEAQAGNLKPLGRNARHVYKSWTEKRVGRKSGYRSERKAAKQIAKIDRNQL